MSTVILMSSAIKPNYTERRYAECRHTERRGTSITLRNDTKSGLKRVFNNIGQNNNTN
jgi:hypothetical protein